MRSIKKVLSVLILTGLILCTAGCKSDKKNKTEVNNDKAVSDVENNNVKEGQPVEAVVTVEEKKYDYISAYKGLLDKSEKDKELKYYLYDIKKNSVKDGIKELFLERIEDEKKQIDVYTIDEKTGEVSLCGTVKGSDSGDLSVKESEVYFNNNFKTVRTITHITIGEDGKVINGLYQQFFEEKYDPIGKLLEGCDVSSDDLLNKYSE